MRYEVLFECFLVWAGRECLCHTRTSQGAPSWCEASGTAHQAVVSSCTPPAIATLHFHTPLRLQANGHALGAERVNARRLILALARRISLLAEFHGSGAPGFDFAALASSEWLQYVGHVSDWERDRYLTRS